MNEYPNVESCFFWPAPVSVSVSRSGFPGSWSGCYCLVTGCGCVPVRCLGFYLVLLSGLSGYDLTFSRFCQAITLLLYLCTALYPVLYPSVPVICPGPCHLVWSAVWSGPRHLICSCPGCCSSCSCILSPVCCPVQSCVQHYRLNTIGIR